MRLITGRCTGTYYPALALIKALKKHDPDAEVLYVGSEWTGKQYRSSQGDPFKSTKIQALNGLCHWKTSRRSTCSEECPRLRR